MKYVTVPRIQGTLTAVMTASMGGSILRHTTVTGSYQVYPNCSGGELLFNLNGIGMQLYLMSDSVAGTSDGIWGTAKVNPLDIMNGTFWSYKTFPGYYIPGADYTSLGIFKAIKGTDRAGNPTGVLNVTQSVRKLFGRGAHVYVERFYVEHSAGAV